MERLIPRRIWIQVDLFLTICFVKIIFDILNKKGWKEEV